MSVQPCGAHKLLAGVALVAEGGVLLVKYRGAPDHQQGWFLPHVLLEHAEHPGSAAQRLPRQQPWYENVIGVEFDPATGTAELGGVHFGIASHSLVHAPAAEPHRLLLSFSTDDIQRDHAALVAKGVEFVRPPEQEPWGGLIATFVDPDGNYLQMMEIPAAPNNDVLAAQHAHV